MLLSGSAAEATDESVFIMEYLFYITVYNISVRVCTNEINVREYFRTNLFSRHMLPAYSYSEDMSNGIPDVELTITNGSSRPMIKFEDGHFFASYKDICRDIRHLSYLVLYVIQACMQRRGLYYIHSAAVDIGGSGILLLGDSGSGKTTAALAACRDFGARIIGDDSVIIGEENYMGVLLAGNNTLFCGERYSEAFSYDDMNKKYYMSVPHYKESSAVRMIVSLTPYCENRTNKNTGQGLRKLVDLMSLHIAGIGYYYLPDRLIYPNMDNSVFAKERFLFAAGLVSSVDVYELCGDRGYIMDGCRELFSRIQASGPQTL